MMDIIVSLVHSNDSYQIGKKNQPTLNAIVRSLDSYVKHH